MCGGETEERHVGKDSILYQLFRPACLHVTDVSLSFGAGLVGRNEMSCEFNLIRAN